MQANLEWINRQWNAWLVTERGKKVTSTSKVKEHIEHIAKLFTAHCMEQLDKENSIHEDWLGVDPMN